MSKYQDPSKCGRRLNMTIHLLLSRLNPVTLNATHWYSHPWKRYKPVWGVSCPRRRLGFRKRAQSAEEESSASLQHLTLTEFLKEYVFSRAASQPCMCGLTHSNRPAPGKKKHPFPDSSINHTGSFSAVVCNLFFLLLPVTASLMCMFLFFNFCCLLISNAWWSKHKLLQIADTLSIASCHGWPKNSIP